ncbi:ChaN family lipoprotein [Aerosakkonemataceae cyanobacterium BLCC-F154]|uniref:ChaN family lipoprotein n=1 Tax=Floridaenema fluviatile BLCC-F154 TaxID=3153640 RepID=A0ABV4YC40_9CYAN
MKPNKLALFCACFLGINLFCVPIANAQKISSPVSQQNYTPQEFFQNLTKANVIYLGETHTSVADHKAQLEIIQQIYGKKPKIAIAMEMFQRPFQGAIDRYLAGKITEEELLTQTEYQQRWGFPWEYYAPILRFAKENRIPVLALNTPSEVTRKVARQGLESLTPEDKEYIPPISEIRTDNAAYRQMLLDVFNQHQQGGHGASESFERFFSAQVLWDETMAENIAKFVKDNPDYTVIVLAGQGHLVYGYGIPSRVSRRLGNSLVQKTILLNFNSEFPLKKDGPIADFFWSN